MRNIEQVYISLCAIVFTAITIASCHATEYPLGPLTLSKPIPDGLQQNYTCTPRIEFSNTLQCSLKKLSAVPAANVSEILVDISTNKILFAADKLRRSGDLVGAERSIVTEMSSSLGGTAPKHFSVDNAVVLVWGDVKLEGISPGTDEYNHITGEIEAQFGLLINTVGDFKAAKDATRPVYRVIGGEGLVVILSETSPKHVVVQRIIVAAATLCEDNFKSQARQFLSNDGDSSPDDYSKWSEIAFEIRRLALNTTAESANRIVDEVFGSSVSRKYYSHVWAFLPTSVIKHLRDGTYMAIDVYGEKTEFATVRDQIIAQLRSSPGEPFSEFLLYTLGRFDEAEHLNARSPIHTVLTYAFAHSTLRQVMSTLFQRAAKLGDKELFDVSPHSYLDEIDSEINQFEEADPHSHTGLAGNSNYIELKKEMDEHTHQLDIKEKEGTEHSLENKDFFNGHAYEQLGTSDDPYRDNQPSLSQYLSYFNQFPERYDSRPMIQKFTDFTVLTDPLLAQFREVLKDQKSPHFDDAAYFLGWLEYHRGDVNEGLDKFELAIGLLPKFDSQSTDNGEELDYADYAVHQTSRILRTLPPEDAINRVQNSKILSSRPELWYSVLSSLYHLHKSRLVMDGALRAMRGFGITIENLPVTTDPIRIKAALTKLNLSGYRELEEIVYLYNASREAEQLESMLSSIDKQKPAAVALAVKGLVIKYSLTKDSDLEDKLPRRGFRSQHKDLRQSIFLAQRALDLLPRNPAYSRLRAWLHYKRITLLAQFDPLKVAAANALLEEEFPNNSVLLNDGMAEQIFSEAVVIGDMAKATATFTALLQKFPAGNAVDNAYSWMAIGWTCIGQPVKAREVNQEIVRLFPLTRHARYARERLREPHACGDVEYVWDHEAMSWRERNRIDVIQHALEIHQL